MSASSIARISSAVAIVLFGVGASHAEDTWLTVHFAELTAGLPEADAECVLEAYTATGAPTSVQTLPLPTAAQLLAVGVVPMRMVGEAVPEAMLMA